MRAFYEMDGGPKGGPGGAAPAAGPKGGPGGAAPDDTPDEPDESD